MCWQDLRFTRRMLAQVSCFTAVAVLISRSASEPHCDIYAPPRVSVDPLPVSDPKEIFHLMRASSEGDFAGEFSYSYPLFQQLSKIASPWASLRKVFCVDVQNRAHRSFPTHRQR